MCEPAERLWGLDDVGRHDRYWYARGVEIVRRGRARRGRGGARAFLLVGPDDLVIGPFSAAARRLHPRGSNTILLIIRGEAGETSEHVRADALGRLVRIERRYGGDRPRSRRRLLLTRDSDLADAWSAAADEVIWPALLVAARRQRWGRATMRGTQFDARDAAARSNCTTELLRRWADPMSVLPGVRPARPGVWAHESSRIRTGARLVGPVWIGAGVTVPDDAVIIGPAVLPDAADAAAPSDWDHPPPLRLPPDVASRRADGVLAASARRAFDLAFATLALVLTAPLYPVIALLIWREDGGPVLFAHSRQTRAGREFTCYKFRTMCRGAEHMRDELAARNLADGPQFHIPDDPRLLRVGQWLRRFHLDELPQFWNVLRGQMSVVGPRPSPDDENQCCPAWREARLSVRPGITGLWQIRRTRGPHADFQEWIRYDLEYVRRRTWRMDLWIILQTVGKVLVR
jgi:lipopolysaccharide/colanic/teichoic acid biosynthesis glycosyltransferase